LTTLVKVFQVNHPTLSIAYFVGNLVTTMVKGSACYDECKKTLQRAIDEYDQAVIDHTASIVSGMFCLSFK
jgi:hypothetical protein